MKNKLFFFIISFTLFTSCVAKKTTTEYKEVIKRDSIYIIKDRFITQKVVDTLRSVKGSIQVSVNIDSIVSSKVKEFKLNYKAEKEIKEVETVIFRTPFWVWLVMLIEGLIIFLLLRF